MNIEKLLAEMEAYAAAAKVPIINEQGRRAYIAILQEIKPHHILEIGTAIGYSALLALQNGADDARITTLELDEKRAALAERFWAESAYRARIELRVGNAGDSLCSLQEKYDFVFIDAAKGQYPDYFRKIQPRLTDDAAIVADNVLFRGYVRSLDKPPRRYRTIVKRLREYIHLVTESPGFTTEIWENGDGLALTRRKKIEKA